MRIAFIPVRIGSKSIPKKNIKEFCGQPLLLYVVQAAANSGWIDKVVVASDSEEINEVALSANSDKVSVYNRTEESATDTASTEFVMLEYLRQANHSPEDTFVLIQATSPFLTSADLDQSLKLYGEGSYDSMLSVVEMKRFLWTSDGHAKNYDHRNRPRRQDFDGELVENGAFYVSTVGQILRDENRLSGEVGVFRMDEISFLELDEPIDWVIAEALYKEYSHKPAASAEIKLVLTDVDGVLTDAGMYYSENGDELKKFNTRDGMGFQMLREAGIKTGIVTSENTEMVSRRGQKLKADFVHQGKRDGGKLAAAKQICDSLSISLENVAYIGDDVNCKQLLQNVGTAMCPADAQAEIKAISGIRILEKKGGEGVFREMVDMILSQKPA